MIDRMAAHLALQMLPGSLPRVFVPCDQIVNNLAENSHESTHIRRAASLPSENGRHCAARGLGRTETI
jgi:hypothetical protein